MYKWLYFFIIGFMFFSPLVLADNLVENKTYQFLVISDIHFDPFQNCSHQQPCLLIQKLRAAPAREWGKILANNNKTLPDYHYDTNYTLLKTTTDFAKTLAETEKVQFVLFLGDALGHNYRRYYKKYAADSTSSGYQSFVRKTLEFLTLELAHSFPAVNVYMATGNNDSYQDDYVAIPNGDFFKETAILWGSLIKNKTSRTSMEEEFAKAGYYALHLDNHTCLILLNSNLFSRNEKGKNIEKAAQDELNWLHQVLSELTAKKQKIFIAMHVPEGIDIYLSPHTPLFTLTNLWKTEYIQRFEAELEQFSANIAGVFSSHLHTNWLHMITYKNNNEVPVIGVASISPIFGNDPTVKIFTYSPQLEKLTNFVSYSLKAKATWEKEYTSAL
ncbi:MAG: metallophosphoesterase [Gammaproteobacteria bacterium]|nr:metallophosphoesterase [Gammaproteobacteria bacterium]